MCAIILDTVIAGHTFHIVSGREGERERERDKEGKREREDREREGGGGGSGLQGVKVWPQP